MNPRAIRRLTEAIKTKNFTVAEEVFADLMQRKVENALVNERKNLQPLREAKKTRLPKVTSLYDLRQKAEAGGELGDRYKKLAILGASNLGGRAVKGNIDKQFQAAMRDLYTNAHETDERGVVGEVNFMIPDELDESYSDKIIRHRCVDCGDFWYGPVDEQECPKCGKRQFEEA